MLPPQPIWRIPCEAIPSWLTPTLYEGTERAELVTNSIEYFRSYDPAIGKELWHIKGVSMISVPTPFAAHALIYLASGYYRFIQPIVALKPGASGDVLAAAMAWHTEKGAPYLPTPIVYGDYFYGLTTAAPLGLQSAHRASASTNNVLPPGAFASSPRCHRRPPLCRWRRW